MKKALVLAGGIPQAELIKNLKNRGIFTILADMNPEAYAVKFADKFITVSALDHDAVKKAAIEEQVDFLITVCADQVLQIVAQVSEELKLPCYIDAKTAADVSHKIFMKEIFMKNGIPTSNFFVVENLDGEHKNDIHYPLIVKPVDSYSSKGVKKVENDSELQIAVENAKRISRSGQVIIEEFNQGRELSVDAYIENGKVNLLCISQIDKIPNTDGFVICRTICPANISDAVSKKVYEVSQQIAVAFNLTDSPLLIQLITDGTDVSVVEFCARTGGGDKYRLIHQMTGVDIIDTVVELTLGNKPHIENIPLKNNRVVNEFLYCLPGVIDHYEGFEECVSEKLVKEFYILKQAGSKVVGARSSGDRVAYFTVEGDTKEEIDLKMKRINSRIKVIDENKCDILRHQIIEGEYCC